MYYWVTFQDQELANRLQLYLIRLWFKVDMEVLCSSIPQYKLTVSMPEEIELNQAQKEIIKFYIPNMFSNE